MVSILDGSTLKLILEDEDDFAMLAENLFTDLDEEDKGKLPKSQIRKALSLMGVDMGVPPLSGFFLFLLPFYSYHVEQVHGFCYVSSPENQASFETSFISDYAKSTS